MRIRDDRLQACSLFFIQANTYWKKICRVHNKSGQPKQQQWPGQVESKKKKKKEHIIFLYPKY
jgi:hypothetical protein